MRIRIGNYVAGITGNKTEHAIFGRFMIGKVADTIGVLNSIKGIQQQMLFADFDSGSISDVFKDLMLLIKLNMKLSDIMLFKSSMKNQPDHYFIISPFHYEPIEIRMIYAIAKHIDPKFVAVYMRDGVNAIRLIPKQIGKNQSRMITFIAVIPQSNKNRATVEGMLQVLADTFPTITQSKLFPIGHPDGSKPSDFMTREYETIRW